jgi:hypothetical protein
MVHEKWSEQFECMYMKFITGPVNLIAKLRQLRLFLPLECVQRFWRILYPGRQIRILDRLPSSLISFFFFLIPLWEMLWLSVYVRFQVSLKAFTWTTVYVRKHMVGGARCIWFKGPTLYCNTMNRLESRSNGSKGQLRSLCATAQTSAENGFLFMRFNSPPLFPLRWRLLF